jgi:hypothetical protein
VIERYPIERLDNIDLPPDGDPDGEPEPAPSIAVGSGEWPTEAQAEGLEAIGLGDAVDQLTEIEARYVLTRHALMYGFAASACCDVGDLDGPRLAIFGPEDEVA